ncbi:MAG: hypothetical protein WD512_07105 [Candidatus Paceibacterota bacterium]
MKFKDAYEFPLELMWSKVHTKDGGMAFDFAKGFGKPNDEDDEECPTQQRVVDIINGKIDGDIKGDFDYKDGDIYLNGKFIITIRGWGNLTSPNCLNLTPEAAARVQDEFAFYIIKRLSGQ